MTEPRIDIADLTQQGLEALAKGETARGREILERVVAAGGGDVAVWLMIAHAAARQNDLEGKVAAIDQALAGAPRDVHALIAKADHCAQIGDQRAAATYYSIALQNAPPIERASPRLREALERARSASGDIVRELEDFVRAKLSVGGISDADVPSRFSRAVDILFQRKRAYVQQPRYLYYPELPNVQFYDRAQFPWMDVLEDATPQIAQEMVAMIGPSFAPYVTQAPGRPRNDQQGLVDNPDWSALFLYKDGVEQPAAQSCKRTIRALADAPLSRIPSRTPSVLFSKLAAGAHIPPHTGMLNTRLICHLPLIVPEGCVFRVGNDERPWEVGKAWAFDDTIEHEAWNRSALDRYILIFDIWRPELSLEERECVSALCQAIDAYRSGVSWDG